MTDEGKPNADLLKIVLKSVQVLPSSVKNQRFLTASPRGSLRRYRAVAKTNSSTNGNFKITNRGERCLPLLVLVLPKQKRGDLHLAFLLQGIDKAALMR